MRNITIVTAFFDIGRDTWPDTIYGIKVPGYVHRTKSIYFENFSRLAKIKNDMIIYTSADHVSTIKNIRAKFAPDSRTKVVSLNFANCVSFIRPKIQKIHSRKEYINLIDMPCFPEYWNADYVLVNYLKSYFIKRAYDSGIIHTELAAWIDFGYVRDDQTLLDGTEWKYDFDPEKMHMFNLKPIDPDRPIFDIIKTGDVYIMGCHIVGGKNAWMEHDNLSVLNMQSLLVCGLIDDDQTILLMNYLRNKNLYDLHYIDTSKNGWFVMFNQFNGTR
jgi:protein YibB